VEIKCQLDATEVFIADLTACSTCFGHHYAHHQELKIIIQVFIADLIACSTCFGHHYAQHQELKIIIQVFIADLTACSICFGHHYAHHQEVKSIIEWLLPVVFRAVVFKLLVWCGAEGYVSGLQDAAASCKPDT